jgi:predicted O-methyltransferase YrrM
MNSKLSLRAAANRFLDFLAFVRYQSLSRAFKIQSHLTVRERVCLYELSSNAAKIAEIGSYVGASACCFSASSSSVNTKQIICIDTWNNDAMSEGNRDTWAEFQENTAGFSSSIIPIRGFSTEVVDRVRSVTSTLNLLFIDGDHSYEGVKADWEAYKSFLVPGSIVIFHDIGWAEGVKRVVAEDVLPIVSDFDALPNMWWGTLAKQP